MPKKCIRKKRITRRYCKDFRTRGVPGTGKCLRRSKKKISQLICAKYK